MKGYDINDWASFKQSGGFEPFDSEPSSSSSGHWNSNGGSEGLRKSGNQGGWEIPVKVLHGLKVDKSGRSEDGHAWTISCASGIS